MGQRIVITVTGRAVRRLGTSFQVRFAVTAGEILL